MKTPENTHSNKSFAMFTSSLGDCHNFCSEFVLDVGTLKDILTAFRNSKKNRLAIFLQIFGILKNNCQIVCNILPNINFCKIYQYFRGMKSKRTTQQKMNNRHINKRHLLYLINGLAGAYVDFFFTLEGPVQVGR